MTYETGTWGAKAKARAKKRRAYFREYRRLHPQTQKYESHGTSLGYRGEVLAQEILQGAIKINQPCDLRWEGKLVEVKTSIKTLMTNRNLKGDTVPCKTYRWKFLLKQKGIAELFFLVCKDTEDKVQYILLIPDKDLNAKHLSIAETSISKYSKYLLALL